MAFWPCQNTMSYDIGIWQMFPWVGDPAKDAIVWK